jgi:hypothetical protein
VMAALQTFNGIIVRVVGEFGGDDGLQAAEDFRAYWDSQPGTLVTWVA